ncbi:MAG: DUF2281 domain-containing protein [Methylotenera sp.]|nr:DUF2281 domain-containing protein [Methylotenera sp.]
MMDATQLVYEIEQLPPQAQHQIEDFIAFIKTRYQADEKKRQPEITQGDKQINASELFGIWEKQPRTIADIREQAWQRSESE